MRQLYVVQYWINQRTQRGRRIYHHRIFKTLSAGNPRAILQYVQTKAELKVLP